MVVYRIAESEFARNISGYGASLYGGRWNKINYSLLYTATSVSLATLEVLVGIQSQSVYKKYKLIVLSVPDEGQKDIINSDQLSFDWIQNLDETQELGTNWVNNSKSFILNVPSAIVPIDKNILINPKHELFSKIEIVDFLDYNFDNRLFKTYVF
ncbi:MAG: RES domain-containing protein [Bacteroidetes bacterium]|nr:MAG: RES domain-containing protein [Bacteroidota bacterium]